MAYGTRGGMELIFGITNINMWADIDNDENPDNITARINWSLQLAEDEVNDRLKDGPYEIPFTGTIDRRIVDLTDRLAGVLLYDSRGIRDSEDEGKDHRLQYHRDKVDTAITNIHNLKLRLTTVAPTVILHPHAIDMG